jgi:hypothetical protein
VNTSVYLKTCFACHVNACTPEVLWHSSWAAIYGNKLPTNFIKAQRNKFCAEISDKIFLTVTDKILMIQKNNEEILNID